MDKTEDPPRKMIIAKSPPCKMIIAKSPPGKMIIAKSPPHKMIIAENHPENRNSLTEDRKNVKPNHVLLLFILALSL